MAGLVLTGSNYKKVVPSKKRRHKTQSRKMKKTSPAAISKLKANRQKTRKEMIIAQVIEMIKIIQTTPNIFLETRRVK